MSQWGNTAVVANSVSWAHALVNKPASNNASLFQNTTPSAFVRDQADGQFSVSVAERKSPNTSGEANRVAHAGWQFRRAGTGPVTSITPAAGGTGYNNTDVITVSGGKVNATAKPVTNSTGGVASVTVLTPGEGFTNTSSLTVAVANSTGGNSAGSNATFVVNLGGRAGRVHYETLVAMSTVANSTANTYFPKS